MKYFFFSILIHPSNSFDLENDVYYSSCRQTFGKIRVDESDSQFPGFETLRGRKKGREREKERERSERGAFLKILLDSYIIFYIFLNIFFSIQTYVEQLIHVLYKKLLHTKVALFRESHYMVCVLFFYMCGNVSKI